MSHLRCGQVEVKGVYRAVKKLDYFLQGGPYVELFSYLSSVTLLCCILPHFGVLCMRQVEQYYVAVNVQYVLGVDT